MLYPKEDRVNNRLMFACRTCQFSEPAPSSCVYRNTLSTTTGETAGVTQDVGSDPTVCPDHYTLHFSLCTLCGKLLHCQLCGDDKPKDGTVKGEVQSRSKVEEDTENGDRRENWHHIFQDWGEDDLCEEDS